MKINIRNIIFFLLLILCVVIGIFVITDMNKKEEKQVVYSEIVEKLDRGDVISFSVDTDARIELIYKLPERDADNNVLTDANGVVYQIIRDANQQPILDANGNVQYITEKTDYRLSYDFQLEEVNRLAKEAYERGELTSYNYAEPKETSWFLTYLPYFILIAVIVIFYIFMMSQASGKSGKMGGFSRARVKLGSNEKKPVRFTDVAGADEEKEELQEVVEFLRNPAKFTRLGARIPRGVLLVGPPGTGKTLLAKAVAGEAGVPFYSISGSDFVEMYVGVGASRVRDLFETARKNPASIIFIDEIDAVGRHRGAGLGGGHDEREQTLNQLLVEMDGFGNHEGVIVMAATNRPYILDPALLRPGRFDRQITVNYPDLKGREDILHVHAARKPLGADVDLHKIAQTTVGFTGADLANLLNEAALLTARRNKSLIGMAEIEESTLKILVGTEKKNKVMTERDRKNTAYHEAGHAILAHLIPGLDPVTRISIIPSSKGALGYTLTPPQIDQYSEYKKVLEGQIAMTLGGRIAEKLVFDDYTGGASQDIKQVTKIARKMVTVYGMSEELGTVCLVGEHSGDEVFLGRDFSSDKNYSEETAAKIDREIKKIIDTCYAMAEKLLKDHMDKLHAVAEYLLKYEVMDADLFRALMDDNATIEDLERIKERKDREMREANERAAAEAAARAREEREHANEQSFSSRSSSTDLPSSDVPH